MTTKVRKYDMQSGWMKEWATPEEREKYVLREKYFILQGPKGIILSYDEEGVHYIEKSVDAEFTLDVYKPDTESIDEQGHKVRSIPMFPVGTIKVPIKEMLEYCDYTEHEAKDMVRVFGNRLDNNWYYLKGSMKKIGLDLNEYDMGREERHGL